MKLSIIIPVFNEEKTISFVLEKLLHLNISWKKEIIVVNDGSTDKSLSIIKKFPGLKLISYRKNKGKGYAVAQGIKNSTGDYLLIQDADLEYNPDDIPALLKKANGKNAVYGNRFSKTKVKMPFFYRLGNKLLTFITNFLYRTKLSDMECGYKLLPSVFVKKMEIKSSRFDFEPEITVKLVKAKIPIVEVPISYQGRNHLAGKKLTVADSVAAVTTLFKHHSLSWDLIFLSVFLFIIFIIYAFIAVSSHHHFLTFGWDLGYFDQIIWKLSRLEYPFSTLNFVNFLANHFSPILLVYALFYRIWSHPDMLLISQAFLVVASAYPLYLLAKAEIRHSFFSFSLVFSYLFFLGTQWSILNEFHEATIIPLFLALFFYAAAKKEKNKLLLLSIIGLLITKEEFSLLAAALSFPLYFFYKRKKPAIILLVVCVAFFFFLTEFFMPAISEKGIYQHAHLSGNAKTPAEFIALLIKDPIFMVKSVFSPREKIRTLMSSLSSFAYLPLLSPLSVLIPSIEQFLMRFLYSGPQFTVWQNVNHHAAPIAILFPVASLFAVVRLIKLYPRKRLKIITFASLLLISATIFQDIIFTAPIHSVFKHSLYRKEEWMKNADSLVGFVPENPAVATQNSLFPHLSQRKEIYLLPEIKNAQYIAVDFHDGPNKFAPLNLEKTKNLVEDLLVEGSFRIEIQKGEAVLLKRVN